MIRSRLIFLLTISSLLGIALSDDVVVGCPFECLNDSVCGLCDGDERKSGGIEICRNGKNCVCPEGFTGLRCGRKYESCYESEHQCQNGGKCIEGMDKYENAQHFCDCSSAKDSNGNPVVGKFCHLQAVVKCDDNGDKFCVEGSECNDNGSCKCRHDFEGEHCEFRKGSVPECDLNCENEGKCVLGINNYAHAIRGYSDFWKAHEEAMYCSCPKGFAGVSCEIQSVTKCRDFDCFNGGKCVHFDSGNDEIYQCDCTNAGTSEIPFAGTYCQYEATSQCETNNGFEGTSFCVNNGVCKEQGAGCFCPGGFTGPLCEYNKTLVEEKVMENCSLECKNDSVCRKGVKEQATQSRSKIDDIPEQTGQYNENFEHCVCKKGFFGLICDKEVEICEDEKHVCLNGSTCKKVEIDGEVNWTCNCDVASTAESRFAGISCQHEASIYCTEDGKPGEGVDETAFCVNGGLCKGFANGTGHPGCQCPDIFQGIHCQYPIDKLQAIISNGNTRSGESTSRFNVILGLSFIPLIALGVYFYVRMTRSDKETDSMESTLKQLEKAMDSPTSIATSITPIALSYDRSDSTGVMTEDDGGELRNIELL
eukprot:CAMPEP_0194133642 /NCGR_PEP_ID=MMETSP0152-20130528/3723_1 /TAXON_ID=1049557 /ORGANISM="Thalassiothrix antarctica, Strain L6-D1" /LENGTH=592 /DNA_ID=CAMNT_0038828985 /DNA_START=40 /DNA_END=1818 /DNA_ORIENTATION=-